MRAFPQEPGAGSLIASTADPGYGRTLLGRFGPAAASRATATPARAPSSSGSETRTVSECAGGRVLGRGGLAAGSGTAWPSSRTEPRHRAGRQHYHQTRHTAGLFGVTAISGAQLSVASGGRYGRGWGQRQGRTNRGSGGLSDVQSISAGRNFVLALKSEADRRLGQRRLRSDEGAGRLTAKQVAAGNDFSIVLEPNGSIVHLG